MPAQKVDELNRSMPAAARSGAALGDMILELQTQHNALCAALDADAGVSATTYSALFGIKLLSAR